MVKIHSVVCIYGDLQTLVSCTEYSYNCLLCFWNHALEWVTSPRMLTVPVIIHYHNINYALTSRQREAVSPDMRQRCLCGYTFKLLDRPKTWNKLAGNVELAAFHNCQSGITKTIAISRY